MILKRTKATFYHENQYTGKRSLGQKFPEIKTAVSPTMECLLCHFTVGIIVNITLVELFRVSRSMAFIWFIFH